MCVCIGGRLHDAPPPQCFHSCAGQTTRGRYDAFLFFTFLSAGLPPLISLTSSPPPSPPLPLIISSSPSPHLLLSSSPHLLLSSSPPLPHLISSSPHLLLLSSPPLLLSSSPSLLLILLIPPPLSSPTLCVSTT